jgi:cytochrome c oxidase accessory protein FixG
MTIGSGSIQGVRRAAGAAQVLLVLGLPFLRVGGESALRFDVPSLTLHVLGASLAMDESFVLVPATLLLTALFGLVTVAFGRVWCGWSCPQTVLGDLTRLVQPWPGKRRRPWRRAAGFALTGVVSAVLAAATLWYFVTPQAFLAALLAGRLGPALGWSWAGLGLTLFLDLAFLRARFCATACPYAKLQGVLYDRATLVVAFDERRVADCTDCRACIRCCPTGIDIREGLQTECIACAECIDACRPVMLKLKRAPDLVGYFYGEPGRPRRLLRPATLALSAGVLLSLGATAAAGLAARQATLDLTVVPSSDFAPRLGPDGRALQAYRVSLESRARGPVSVRLAAAAAAGVEASVRPETVSLGPGQHASVRVVVTARGAPGRFELTLTAHATGDGVRPATASARVLLVIPEPP